MTIQVVVNGKTIPIPRDVATDSPEAIEEYVAKRTPKSKNKTPSPEEGVK